MCDKYKVKELVTNVPDVADYYDPRLVYPGGMAVGHDRQYGLLTTEMTLINDVLPTMICMVFS